MADRAHGVLRWGNGERRLVNQYLEDGNIDPTRVGSAAYLRTIKRQEALWERHSNKNFYQNVRRQTAQWQADGERRGGRRAGNPDAGNDDDDDDDDNDDDDDDVGEDGDEAQGVAGEAAMAQPPPRRRAAPAARESFLLHHSKFILHIINNLSFTQELLDELLHPLKTETRHC